MALRTFYCISIRCRNQHLSKGRGVKVEGMNKDMIFIQILGCLVLIKVMCGCKLQSCDVHAEPTLVVTCNVHACVAF